jgi:hypothetical protein
MANLSAKGLDRSKAYSEPGLTPWMAAHVPRIRYERLRLATAEVPENFLWIVVDSAVVRRGVGGALYACGVVPPCRPAGTGPAEDCGGHWGRR